MLQEIIYWPGEGKASVGKRWVQPAPAAPSAKSWGGERMPRAVVASWTAFGRAQLGSGWHVALSQPRSSFLLR